MSVLEICEGELFIMTSPDQPDKVYRRLGTEKYPGEEGIKSVWIVPIAFEMDGFWFTYREPMESPCNPYATGRRVKMAFVPA